MKKEKKKEKARARPRERESRQADLQIDRQAVKKPRPANRQTTRYADGQAKSLIDM